MHLSIDVSQMESDHDVRLEFVSFRVLIKSSMTIPFLVLDWFLSSHSFNSFLPFHILIVIHYIVLGIFPDLELYLNYH